MPKRGSKRLKKLKRLTRQRRFPILFIVIFAAVGATLLLITRAASPLISVEPENSNISGSAQLISDSEASNGQYVVFGEDAETWFGYTKPGPQNTGPTDTSNLTNISNSQLESMMTDGGVIENVRISGGMISPTANNVTIRNFILDAGGNRYGIYMNSQYNNLTLEDGEIYNVTSAAILGMGFTAKRLNIHESGGDGIKSQNTAGIGGPVLVESSWIHNLGTNDGAHADGNQSRSGAYPILFRGNNCDMPVNEKGGPGLPYKSNACFIIQNGAEGPIVDFTARYNWLNGGNNTVYCSSNAHIEYNRFGRQYRYGIRSGTCTTWANNVWDDTGEPLDL